MACDYPCSWFEAVGCISIVCRNHIHTLPPRISAMSTKTEMIARSNQIGFARWMMASPSRIPASSGMMAAQDKISVWPSSRPIKTSVGSCTRPSAMKKMAMVDNIDGNDNSDGVINLKIQFHVVNGCGSCLLCYCLHRQVCSTKKLPFQLAEHAHRIPEHVLLLCCIHLSWNVRPHTVRKGLRWDLAAHLPQKLHQLRLR